MGKSLVQSVISESHPDTLRCRQLERDLSRVTGRAKLAEDRYTHAERELAEALKRQEYLDLLNREPHHRSISLKRAKPTGSASAMVMWNDWHVEELVDPNTVNGLNSYNLKVAEQRFLKTLEKTILLLESARTISKIDHIVLCLLGDHITGYIHEELVESNLLSPTEALLFAQDMIDTGIRFLLKEARVSQIDVVTCVGNHGRTTLKPRVSTSCKNSFEWLMYVELAKFHANTPKLNWKIGTGYHNFIEVQKKLVRCHHGDAIKYGGGVGGLTIPTLKAIAQWDRVQRADLDMFGHYHTFMWHPKFIVGNCLIGYNAYAVKIKADESDPSQTFVVIDRARKHPVTVQETYCT